MAATSTKRKNSANAQRGEKNRKWGAEAERIATDYFITAGYTVRENNWKSGKAEIDLILEKDRTIIFVEVKARKPETQDPVDAVDRKKRQMIMRAADSYMSHLQVLYEYRFDIFVVIGDPDNYKTAHYPDTIMPTVNNR
ncbi:MAG: YraN family protein [Muribaculaceae bacterium]|nr:YraN family protein [Muribaculaceae bacterium]